MNLGFPAFGFLKSVLDTWQSTVAQGEVSAQVDNRLASGMRAGPSAISTRHHLASLFVDDVLTERPLSSRASSAYEQGRLSKN